MVREGAALRFTPCEQAGLGCKRIKPYRFRPMSEWIYLGFSSFGYQERIRTPSMSITTSNVLFSHSFSELKPLMSE
jgi:hypothetical protein